MFNYEETVSLLLPQPVRIRFSCRCHSTLRAPVQVTLLLREYQQLIAHTSVTVQAAGVFTPGLPSQCSGRGRCGGGEEGWLRMSAPAWERQGHAQLCAFCLGLPALPSVPSWAAQPLPFLAGTG